MSNSITVFLTIRFLNNLKISYIDCYFELLDSYYYILLTYIYTYYILLTIIIYYYYMATLAHVESPRLLSWQEGLRPETINVMQESRSPIVQAMLAYANGGGTAYNHILSNLRDTENPKLIKKRKHYQEVYRECLESRGRTCSSHNLYTIGRRIENKQDKGINPNQTLIALQTLLDQVNTCPLGKPLASELMLRGFLSQLLLSPKIATAIDALVKSQQTLNPNATFASMLTIERIQDILAQSATSGDGIKTLAALSFLHIADSVQLLRPIIGACDDPLTIAECEEILLDPK